jgi:protein-tyrosine phosphatase
VDPIKSNFRDHTASLRNKSPVGIKPLPAGFRIFFDDLTQDFNHHWSTAVHSQEVANKVYPGIWVGSVVAASDQRFLKKNDIKSILNMAVEIDYPPPPAIFLAKVGIDDSVPAPTGAFVLAAKEIELARQQSKNILVHCAAGISRSSTAVLSYLMSKKGVGFEDGKKKLRAARSQINPHPALVRSLLRDLGPGFVK